MILSLHKNATTTPAIRAKIAASGEPAAELAGRPGVTLDTIYHWRGRTRFEDRSPTAHLFATRLTSVQEAVAVELRRMLLLPLDDLLAVTREFLNPDVSRSGLDRCLRRHGVSNLDALRPKMRIPRKMGIDSTGSWALVPRHRGQPFHAKVGGWFDRRFHGVRLGLTGQGLSCGRRLFACFLR
jgi:hypothetical protein